MRSRHLSNSSLVALLVAAAPLMAQGVSAQLGGRVLDTTGAGVAGATVVIRNSETGLTRTLQTNSEGRYLATLLPVGPYNVTVTKTGFQTASNVKVNLNLGDAAPLTVRLASMTGAVVEVVAAASAVDTERASAAAIISPDALSNLPSFNRSFTSLATLTPQVVVDSSRGNLAISGQRGVNSSINIDGGDNNEPFFGGALGAAEGKTPFTISIEAIREYQVITDGASAEFGRMGGGYVNAITKNGTNDVAGSLFYYTRPQSLVARQPNLNGVPNSNAVADFKQQQFGFSVGGPILKDKLFYFVTYDGQRKTNPINFQWGGNSPVTLSPATSPADAALAARAGNYDTHENSDTVFARFDWILNNDHNFQFRVNQSKFKGDSYTGLTSAYENSISDTIKTMALVGQWNWTIGTNWVNEFRFNFSKDEMPRTTRANTPQVSISNVGYYGANPYPRDYETKRTQISESLSYVNTTFQIKGGFDLNRISVSEIFSSFYQGGYTFNDSGSGASLVKAIDNFRAGKWARYSQRFSLIPGLDGWQAGAFDATEDQQAAFIQADWRVMDTLRLGLGVRWDRQTHPDFAIPDFSAPLATAMPLTARIPTDSQFSPRFSFTWTPESDRGNTVVRGSLGRYVSTTPSVFLYQVYTVNGVRMAQVDFTGLNTTTNVDPINTYGIPYGTNFNPNSPYMLPGLPTGASTPKSDIFTFAPNFRNPYTDRANLGIERAYPNGWVLGLSGTYAIGKNLERLTDINLPATVSATSGRLVFSTTSLVRPNTNFAKMMVYVSDAESRYTALTVSAKYQKPDSPFQAQFFYTFAQDRDNDSNERNFSSYSQQNTQRLQDDWSWSDRDRRHVLTGSLSYLDTKWTGIQTGFTLRYVSGSPYSLTYSGDLNKDGVSGNDRFYANGLDSGRNSQRAASNTSIDMRLSREWKFAKRLGFTVSADVFNLLNRHDTYLQNYISGSSDSNGTVLTRNSVVGIARQVQLGARLSF